MSGFPTVLVVDDEALHRDVLAHQLRLLGHPALVEAANGSEALQQFEAHSGSNALIITDLQMPDMDGLVLMRHLSQRGYGGAMVLLSGLPDEIMSSASALAEAHGLQLLACLGKPCKLDHLQRVLARFQPAQGSLERPNPHASLTAQRLGQALQAGEFVPWYQPKIDLASGKACGVEALARWPQADGSLIGPADFIPALESAGLISALFYSLTRQVVAAAAQWRRQLLPISAAINLSMDSARDLDMPERVHQLTRQAGLDPADLVIEVTESQLMSERTVAMESLTRLSMMGYMLSIDDFGTGYSSLVQLIDLPFRELKIDASFVQRAGIDRKAKSVLQTAIALGHNLNLRVVAEGVESVDQQALLRHFGCPVAQGYLYARPMSQADCTRWLLQQR